MKNLITRFLLVVGLLACSAPVFAAETFVPAFDRDQHVMLDPLMANRTPLDVKFAQALVDKGREKGNEVYLVVLQRGDELATMPAANWAASYTNSRLLTAWKYSPGYNEANAEIIVYIRDTNSDAGSIFVHAGTRLMNAGIGMSVLSDPNGPVLPASRQYVRTDAQLAFLTIQDNINAAFDHQPTRILGLTLWTWFWIIVIIIVVLIILSASTGGGFLFIGGCSGGGSSCSSCSSGGGGDT